MAASSSAPPVEYNNTGSSICLQINAAVSAIVEPSARSGYLPERGVIIEHMGHRRTSDGGRSAMSKGRMEAFSDGVIAVLIIIMVLGLKVPRDVTTG